MKRSSPFNSCGNRGGDQLFELLSDAVNAHSLAAEVQKINCLGYCEDGPNIAAIGTGKVWTGASHSTVEQIINFCKEKTKPSR